jgi:hypothetical protein
MKRWWYHAAIRNARLTLSSASVLVGFAVFFLMARAMDWYSRPEVPAFGPPQQPPPGIAFGLLLGGAVIYGAYRVIAFHPAFRPGYREWLRTTPWQTSLALPLGPVHLTLGDALLMTLATAVLWYVFPAYSLFLAILCFAGPHLLLLFIAVLSSGPRGYAYLTLFGLGAMLMSATRPGVACGIALATYLIGARGLHLGLPWAVEEGRSRTADDHSDELEATWRAFAVSTQSTSPHLERARRQPQNLAWPFAYLGPYRPRLRLPVFDAVCLCLLAGWMTASALFFFKDASGDGRHGEESTRGVALFLWLPMFAVLGARMLQFLASHRPSISLAGRLATFRWFIPSYDRAFLAPLAGMAFFASSMPLALRFLTGDWAIVRIAAIVAGTLLIGLVPGPAYRDWILTSECRIVATKPPERRG